MRSRSLLLAVVMLAGCVEMHQNWYTVKLIRPDGGVQSTFSIESVARPWVTSVDGCLVVDQVEGRRLWAPMGWGLTVEERAERD